MVADSETPMRTSSENCSPTSNWKKRSSARTVCQRKKHVTRPGAPSAIRRSSGNTSTRHGAGRRSNDFYRTLVTQCDNYGGLRDSASSRC